VPNPEPGAPRNERKNYVLEMLPYPSGSLHIGHVLVYTLGDVLAHFYRRTGSEVLRPMGYDSFGLPAENAALKEGEHPRKIVERNIERIRGQMKRMGWAIDWSRELSTHEPEYYRWTQWLFLKLFEAGHAYRTAAVVNWCPNDQTVLANEQVKDGHCERCGAEVEARKLDEWFFRITAYADHLLDEMKDVEWPERVLAMQRNWIGRSEGAEVLFRGPARIDEIPVFTTRPDTLFGATFFVLAPEHPLVDQLAERSPNGDEIRDYARKAGARPAKERAAGTDKTGVFTGFFATNPVNGARIPIWIADYVLMDYGTGAIMAVPAPDERDREFAERFDLPIKVVIDDDGKLADSAQFSSLPHDEAAKAIVEWLGTHGRGRPAVSYRLRDWGWSRQRGAARFRSSTATSAASFPCRRTTCQFCCPRSRTTSPRASRRWRRPKTGSVSRARAAAKRAAVRSRRWTPLSIRPGTSSVTAIRTTTARRTTARSRTTGCRSTTTPAASTIRPST
jgi:leucyl-tRNA synthetase